VIFLTSLDPLSRVNLQAHATIKEPNLLKNQNTTTAMRTDYRTEADSQVYYVTHYTGITEAYSQQNTHYKTEQEHTTV